LQCSTNELTSIGGQISAAKVQVNLLERVTRLHDLLESLKKFELEADVVGYAKSVSEAEKILSDAEDGIETELEVWSNIQSEVEQYKNQLMKFLDDGWNSTVEWEQGDLTTLKLGSNQSLIAIFTALSIIEELDRLLSDLGSRILEEILLPLLKADSTVDCEDELQIVKGKEETEELRSLEAVLKNMSVTFQFLVKHFSFEVNNGTSVVTLIGQQISDEFSKQFVKNCLKSTLPASSCLLSSSEYLSYLEKVTQFEKVLRDIGFISDKADGSGAMGEFVTNVDVFFADKVCLESLTKARQLMCVDLHDTIELKGDNQADQTLGVEAVAMERMDGTDGSHHLWKMLNEGGMEMKSSPFSFPNCQISRATQQLIELLSSLINEAVLCSATERCAARLLFTVRSICELYVSVVPEYHRDNLEQLPFHAAVAHNNGMYLAHSILTLGTSHLIKILNQNTVPLMDLVGKFRQLAAHIFLDHMKRQRQQLLAILKEGGFNRLGSESRLPASTENAIRQCLHQLRNLQKIWQPVLPEEVYLRAVGTLSNSVLDELLIRITNLEDIPADAALQLVDQCQVISTTLPLLFVSAPAEVYGSNHRQDHPRCRRNCDCCLRRRIKVQPAPSARWSTTSICGRDSRSCSVCSVLD